MANPHAWFLSDLDKIPKAEIKVMTTFSCGGGSSMGYKRAGCDVVAANDIDPEMAYHYRLNLDPKHYFLCPIRELIGAKLPDELFGIDILDGSPPCSTFSTAGSREKGWGKEKHFREGQAKQVLSDLFFDYLDLVEYLKPKVVIAENVKGMILGNAKGYCRLITTRLRELGYSPQLFLLNAADCGVPQTRERVFFCAVRAELQKRPLTLAPSCKWVSAGEACEDLQDLSPTEQIDTAPSTSDRFWAGTLPGHSYAEASKRQTGKSSFFTWTRLSGNSPSCTLSSQPHTTLHWTECRKLTLREWIRLGSFPDDYQVKTPSIGKYMIGMSVPPKMTEVVAKAVISQWLQPS